MPLLLRTAHRPFLKRAPFPPGLHYPGLCTRTTSVPQQEIEKIRAIQETVTCVVRHSGLHVTLGPFRASGEGPRLRQRPGVGLDKMLLHCMVARCHLGMSRNIGQKIILCILSSLCFPRTSNSLHQLLEVIESTLYLINHSSCKHRSTPI